MYKCMTIWKYLAEKSFMVTILVPNNGDTPMGPPGEFGTREIAQRLEDISR